MLRRAFLSLTRKAPSPPRFVLGAGMITSSLGLVEVPHVLAPAGAEKLSQCVRMKTFPEVSPLPFFLVPGVRIQRAPCQLGSAERADIIRGEETEIVGLLGPRNPGKPWLFVHLGSHAKAIQIDGRGRIIKSTSTLSGECLHVLRTQTILASRLARLKSRRLNERFFFQGARYAKRSGLLRTLFMVRLLEENPRYRPADLYSFLVGALLRSDLHAFESQGLLNSPNNSILLSGNPDLLAAWSLMLRKRRRDVQIVSPQERIAAFLEGLRRIVFTSPPFRRFAARERAQHPD
jgi:2-dehydro-3-deoxygalactonokinase